MVRSNLVISLVPLVHVVPVKSKVKISQNFVAFSEYMNFMYFDALVVFVTKFSLLLIQIGSVIRCQDKDYYNARATKAGGLKLLTKQAYFFFG